MKITWGITLSFVCLVLLSTGLSAQNLVLEVHDARLSIPFGDINGTLLKVGEYLVFIDEDQPDNSFAMQKNDIRNITAQGTRVTVDLNRPVRSRSGERTSFSFELGAPADAMALTTWPHAGATANTGATQTWAPSNETNGVIASYPVTHGHLFGNCHGRLIVRQDIIAYESIDELKDSRQWALRDVRELELKNPYELKIKPFRGDDYTLDFDGKGMDTGIYRQLVERVTSSRVAE